MPPSSGLQMARQHSAAVRRPRHQHRARRSSARHWTASASSSTRSPPYRARVCAPCSPAVALRAVSFPKAKRTASCWPAASRLRYHRTTRTAATCSTAPSNCIAAGARCVRSARLPAARLRARVTWMHVFVLQHPSPFRVSLHIRQHMRWWRVSVSAELEVRRRHHFSIRDRQCG